MICCLSVLPSDVVREFRQLAVVIIVTCVDSVSLDTSSKLLIILRSDTESVVPVNEGQTEFSWKT